MSSAFRNNRDRSCSIVFSSLSKRRSFQSRCDCSTVQEQCRYTICKNDVKQIAIIFFPRVIKVEVSILLLHFVH